MKYSELRALLAQPAKPLIGIPIFPGDVPEEDPDLSGFYLVRLTPDGSAGSGGGGDVSATASGSSASAVPPRLVPLAVGNKRRSGETEGQNDQMPLSKAPRR